MTDAASIDATHRHVLTCDGIEQKFCIDVALPHAYQPGKGKPLPVIYLTDGNLMFPMVTSTMRLLQLGREMPLAILVGIGYADATSDEVLSLRSRDLTPTLDVDFVARTNKSSRPLMDGITPGGADHFLDFIQNTIRPFVAGNYPVLDSDSTLMGDSLGGLFALHALFKQPESFRRYVVGSPSLWWDAAMLLQVAREFAAAEQNLDIDLFLSVGAMEEGMDPSSDWAAMVSNLHTLLDIFRKPAYAGLRLTEQVFPGETHLSVIPATFSRGLRAVFADSPLSHKASPLRVRPESQS